MTEKPIYQQNIERHYDAILGLITHFITKLADEAVEMAARGVALAAPLPNAISMYNITQTDLGWHWSAALAFALSLEVIVFLLVEIALMQWDGYLHQPRRYKAPFIGMIGVVIMGVLVVMAFVYLLESHKIMAALPIISLCSFVAIGLKRWHEKNNVSVKSTVKGVKSGVKILHSNFTGSVKGVKGDDFTPVKSEEQPVKSDFTPRQQELLQLLQAMDGLPAESLNKSEIARKMNLSRPTLNKELEILQASGHVNINGHVDVKL